MPNLIVINYVQSYIPIFYVGFICKGCVWERECEDLRQLKTKTVFASSLQVSFPHSEASALHMTGMRRVRIGWKQLVFTSVFWVRPSYEIPTKHSVLLNYYIWYTISIPTLYIPPLPTDVKECFWEKTLTWDLKIFIPTILYKIHCGFSSTPTSPFPYPWEVDCPNTYHTISECQVRFWCCWKVLKEAKLWQMQ